jgi:hypothetical protein
MWILIICALMLCSFGAAGLITGIAPTFAFASPVSGSIDQGAAKMHLDEAMKALQAGDTA